MSGSLFLTILLVFSIHEMGQVLTLHICCLFQLRCQNIASHVGFLNSRIFHCSKMQLSLVTITYICDLQRLRHACAYAQSRQSVHCWLTLNMEVDEGVDDKNDDLSGDSESEWYVYKF